MLLKAGHTAGIYLVGAGPQANRVPKDSLAAVERLQGIKEALGAGGVRVAGAVACPDWQPELGYSATRQLLERATPSALICFNDRLAFGAYQALADAGLEVPTDVSIVSFDDDVLASWVKPQLTTVALPHYDLGRAAIEVLLDRGQRAASRRTAADPQDPDAAARAGVGEKRHGIATSPTHNGAQLTGATRTSASGLATARRRHCRRKFSCEPMSLIDHVWVPRPSRLTPAGAETPGCPVRLGSRRCPGADGAIPPRSRGA